MALLQQQSLLAIGCSNILARARVQCLAAASHAPRLPLLHVNGGNKAHAPTLKTGNAMSLSRRRGRDLCVVAEASTAANVTPAKPRSVSISDVLWPSAGKRIPGNGSTRKLDQMLAFKGVTLTIAPLGAVCCVLFSAPDSPAAKVHS
ncbi:hypothetical protein PR202_ga13034 [Eleusine coracana subsp. coracana]|uniref:Uncharacterized protein n=1 Tax=Eleusine coracana subsp. coracana TaxID=191504 RepID=A0AAV5CD62_ELECO|nr:hypothetical protein PR202_ga13034 [Eleusine coracana subsp. coracana]